MCLGPAQSFPYLSGVCVCAAGHEIQFLAHVASRRLRGQLRGTFRLMNVNSRTDRWYLHHLQTCRPFCGPPGMCSAMRRARVKVLRRRLQARPLRQPQLLEPVATHAKQSERSRAATASALPTAEQCAKHQLANQMLHGAFEASTVLILALCKPLAPRCKLERSQFCISKPGYRICVHMHALRKRGSM
jgi:hypothetical protein